MPKNGESENSIKKTTAKASMKQTNAENKKESERKVAVKKEAKIKDDTGIKKEKNKKNTKVEEQKKPKVIKEKIQNKVVENVSEPEQGKKETEEKTKLKVETTFEKKESVPSILFIKNDKKREFQTLEVIILVILTCVISLAVGGLLGIKFKDKSFVGGVKVAGSELQKFIEDYHYLIDHYYGDIDKKELLNTAFKSMVDSLDDTYSGSLGETSNNFDIELKGSYEGLGVEIINDENNNILIYSIIPNSPASKVDLKAGDQLLRVNDIDISGMKTTDFINQIIKGSGATSFHIEFKRDGKNNTVELKKEFITLQSVTSKLFSEKGKRIGYLKVSIFADNTYEQFKKELENLEKKGMQTLIIDLRDNSGGHLTAVENMLGLFLDSSHVIYQTETKKTRKKVYSNGKETKSYPIAIIGNNMSASASEVMIGALTEEYGAVFIGERTFGKGTVQELHTLSNGDEYKFTTKKWLTPKGVWVHGNGIHPKFEESLGEEYYKNPTEENDNQLQRAIQYLKRYEL